MSIKFVEIICFSLKLPSFEVTSASKSGLEMDTASTALTTSSWATATTMAASARSRNLNDLILQRSQKIWQVVGRLPMVQMSNEDCNHWPVSVFQRVNDWSVFFESFNVTNFMKKYSSHGNEGSIFQNKTLTCADVDLWVQKNSIEIFFRDVTYEIITVV